MKHKMTRGKFYAFLFGSIAVAYIAFTIAKMLGQKSERFEHFEDASYKYRMEVMKVFDMYLNRNPTTEEIDKYSALKNEHDILTKILADFNITNVDAVEKPLAKEAPAEKKDTVPVKVDGFQDDDSDSASPTSGKTSDDVQEKDAQKSEQFKETRKMVCIPKSSYDELKTLLLSLQAKIEEAEL